MSDAMAQIRKSCNQYMHPTKRCTITEPAPICALVDDLLRIVRLCRVIVAKPEPDKAIRFTIATGEEEAIEVYGGSYATRTICARLAKLASELDGGTFEPYGAHHEVVIGTGDDRYRVRIDTANDNRKPIWFRIELLD